ncbi:uncharacterized protein LOC126836256 [Adelges cooleyi]|uniref:uncharacterized protein LOC126836256 n=1 Tax=Adelges cooleyi TaxID=133065 RepID=UPI002180434B|nr:uncharacterized protein LOC126836256 [Adelges cooleyi]
MKFLWSTLMLSGFLSVPCLRAASLHRKSEFVQLDEPLLDRIQQTTEEIVRNSTIEFVDHETQTMIDLFVNNLKILVEDLKRNSSMENITDVGDVRMKEMQKRGLTMFENTVITIDYIVSKINVLNKSVEELEQFDKYIVDETKRLDESSGEVLKKKSSMVSDKIKMSKRFIEKHIDRLKEGNVVLKGIGKDMMAALKVHDIYDLYRLILQWSKMN